MSSNSDESPPTKRPPSTTPTKKAVRSVQERSIPFNCSMPYAEFVKLEETAHSEGITRSELLRRAMQLYYYREFSK